jgi:hypothetical protein
LSFRGQEVAVVVDIVAFRDAVVEGFQQAVCSIRFGGVGCGGIPVGEGLAVAGVVGVGAVAVWRL